MPLTRDPDSGDGTAATPAPRNPGDWHDKAADLVLRGLIGAAMRLPYERRVVAMGRLVAGAIGPLAGYRARAQAHLAMVYPALDARARRALARACCDNFGRTLIENYSWAELGARLVQTDPEGPGVAALQTAAAARQPVIFATGHFGNHEVPRHVLTRLGYCVGGLYRPMQNAFFNAHYARTMTSWGGPVFAQGRRGTAGFVRHLRAGGMGTLLFDVAANGPAIPFLGHPAHTATSIGDLAQRTGAVVIPYFARRLPDGFSFAVTLDAPVPHAAPADMMLALTQALERRIADDPAQWFWVHRRWKPRATA